LNQARARGGGGSTKKGETPKAGGVDLREGVKRRGPLLRGFRNTRNWGDSLNGKTDLSEVDADEASDQSEVGARASGSGGRGGKNGGGVFKGLEPNLHLENGRGLGDQRK